MKRLQLRYWGGETAEVLCMESVGLNQFEGAIGTVTRNQAGLWSARAQDGSNHTSKWNAAKQLALQLGKGDYL